MAQTTLSPKYQVVIPKEIRSEVPLVVGQKLQVIAKGGIITLVPDRPLASLRGFAKGANGEGFREKRDRM
jgi:AbrB family looped-hinge helix DNA binding protein